MTKSTTTATTNTDSAEGIEIDPTDALTVHSAEGIEILDTLSDHIAFARGVEASLFGVLYVTNSTMISGPINLQQALIRNLEAFEQRLDHLLRADQPAPKAPAKQRTSRRPKRKRS
jgi:hypothetical protein